MTYTEQVRLQSYLIWQQEGRPIGDDVEHSHILGLHASLSITVEGQSSQFRQPDVHEGQTLEVAGYRIFVEKIVPDAERGTIIVRIWAP